MKLNTAPAFVVPALLVLAPLRKIFCLTKTKIKENNNATGYNKNPASDNWTTNDDITFYVNTTDLFGANCTVHSNIPDSGKDDSLSKFSYTPSGISENSYKNSENLAEFLGEDINSFTTHSASIIEVSTMKVSGMKNTMKTGVMAEIKHMDITRIKADQNQPRKTFNNLGGLAETISKHGVIQPIEVDENYQIIIGERRWRAAKLAGLTEIPVIVKTGLGDAEKLEHQLIEDLQDEELPVLERAEAWFKLKNLKGLTNLELSKTLGISERHVYRVLSLNNLPHIMAKALKEDRISATDLMELRSLPIKEQLPVFKKTIESRGKKFICDRINSLTKVNTQKRFLDIKARDLLRELGANIDSVNRNALVAHQGEKMKHFVVKAMIYKLLREHGKVTGCEMEIGSAQADVVDLSSSHVYEVENNASPSHIKKKLEQFRALKDLFIIELAKVPDNLKEMEAYLRERVV